MAANTARALDYGIEHFESNSSVAREVKNEGETVRLRKLADKTNEQLRNEELHTLKKSVVLLCFVLVVFGIISLQISAGAENYRLTREIQSAQNALSIAQSENIRLNSELNGITSIAIIDSYATEVLGMTKIESYQIECIDLSDGDSVLFTSGAVGK